MSSEMNPLIPAGIGVAAVVGAFVVDELSLLQGRLIEKKQTRDADRRGIKQQDPKKNNLQK